MAEGFHVHIVVLVSPLLARAIYSGNMLISILAGSIVQPKSN